MPAFIWYTNHRMWKVVPPFTDSREVLKAYIVDPCAYVYWSTPRHHEEIRLGDQAYIYLTADEDGRDGIVACGVIEETPRQLTAMTRRLFAQPERLAPAGWDEIVAPSAWKTGIRITATYWDAPITAGLRTPVGAIARLSEDAARAVEGEIGAR